MNNITGQLYRVSVTFGKNETKRSAAGYRRKLLNADRQKTFSKYNISATRQYSFSD